MANQTRAEIVATLGQIRTGSTFCSVMGYTNNQGEVSDFSIAFHVSYRGILERSIEKLKMFRTNDAVEDMAAKELIVSWNNSIKNIDVKNYEECQKHYDYFFEPEGSQQRLIKGVKMHRDSGSIHITGYRVHKRIVKPVEYKEVNESAKARAKRILSANCPIGKYRQFKLVIDRFDRIVVEKVSVFPPID